MSKVRVPFIKPHLPPASLVAEDYNSIIDSNWFTNFGPFESKFRDAAAEFIDQDVYASTVTNATVGLELALKSLIKTIHSGKRVIIPSFTFAAGAEAIISCGLTPVFVDIDMKTWQPNIKQARDYIQKNKQEMAGILLCNIFGVGNRLIGEWEALSRQYNLPLIIDTAAGFGSQYTINEMVGGRGDCEVFSLHATKPFAIGEGGMVISKSKSFIKNIQQLQNFGFGPDRHIEGIGTNAKMQEISAAIGLRQFDGFKDRLKSRRNTLQIYKNLLPGFSFQENDELSTVPFVSTMASSAHLADIGYHQLLDDGVEVRRYYQPLHTEGVIMKESIVADKLTVTEEVARRIISLPVHDDMDEDIIISICATLNELT